MRSAQRGGARARVLGMLDCGRPRGRARGDLGGVAVSNSVRRWRSTRRATWRQQLAAELPTYLHDRVNTSIGIVWRLKTELALEVHCDIRCFADSTLSPRRMLPTRPDGEDKRLLLSVRATPWGYELAAREFDRYVAALGTDDPPLDSAARRVGGATL